MYVFCASVRKFQMNQSKFEKNNYSPQSYPGLSTPSYSNVLVSSFQFFQKWNLQRDFQDLVSTRLQYFSIISRSIALFVPLGRLNFQNGHLVQFFRPFLTFPRLTTKLVMIIIAEPLNMDLDNNIWTQNDKNVNNL